jgi:hypothetical protein
MKPDMVARTRSRQEALRIVFARDGEEVINNLAMSGEEAGRVACLMLAGIGALRAGDTLRIIAADGEVVPLPTRQP